MNNSIYYHGFNRLLSLTKSPKEALLLDKIIFHSQGSLLKRDGRLWFTRKIPDLATDLGFSESRIYIYLKNLEEAGYIIRRRFKFYGVPRCFIGLTDSLQNQLKIYSKPPNTIEIKEKTSSINTDISERIDSPVSRDSSNKEKNRVINNITYCNSQSKLAFSEFNAVKGMLFNIQKAPGAKISSPQKVFDEILFSLGSKEQFPSIDSFKHKLNIISKLLRTNRWRTPKGFDKYSPNASFYKKEEEKNNALRTKLRREELAYSGLDEFTIAKRLQNLNESIPQPSLRSNLLRDLQVQQSVINGIKKNMKTINNGNILNNFLSMLSQEEVKLSKIQDQMSSLI
ncbi:hypothetical protein [Legionella birminghamensis]|uniref:hypothetical protein n=1 Tax=Legionella birminghamensis TaxID=28083 RepID=UPI00104188C6|nr:hypothetical protein [Legionella birminghamensis]